MVVSAQTPGAQPISSTDSSSSVSSPSAADRDQSKQASPSAGVSNQASEQAVRHSSTVRFVSAAVCLAVGVLAAVAISLNPGEQPVKLVAFLSAGVCALVTLVEAATSWIVRKRSHSVFDPLPLVGCALITAAVVSELLVSSAPVLSVLLITAPAIAAATLCLGNGLSILGTNLARTDTDYLFPSARSAASQYGLGDSISLRAGDTIPVDGRIESGSVGVDERVMSPVAAFRIREEQEIVYAGSEILAGTAQVTALSGANDSCLAQLQNVVAPIADESAESLQNEDSRASRWTAFAICFVAAALAIAWRERSGQVASPLLAAGCVLLLASICQASDFLYGQRRALTRRWLQRGYLLGFASSVRDLSRVSRIECDSSRGGQGSLVHATHLEILDDRLAVPALCDFLASLLGRAEDKMLLAAAGYCRDHAAKLSLERALELREYPGRGICGTIHGVELSVGSEDFLVERGIMVQPTESGVDHERGEPLLLVAIDDDVVARFWISASQEHLFEDIEESGSADGVGLVQSSGVARELGEETLLVRGTESDLIGQTAKYEVGLFSAEEGALRRTTVVAFTPDISPLKLLVRECYAHVRSVDRLRLMVGFGGLVTVAAAFIGAFTPVIPFAWLALSAIAIGAPRGARG
jgi:hypothetical protein